MSDQYKTIEINALGEFRDRGSKFLAYAYPFRDENLLAEILLALRKEHPKACHWCYAYRIGLDKNNFRANDDGEPGGTAGKPILGQLDSFEITNTLIVVVRYFGGTLLGTSGLMEAYRAAAKDALQNASIIQKQLCSVYQFTFDYSLMADVMNAVKKLNIEILTKDFSDIAKIEIAIPTSNTESKLLTIKALILKVTEDEASKISEIGGLKIQYLSTE